MDNGGFCSSECVLHGAKVENRCKAVKLRSVMSMSAWMRGNKSLPLFPSHLRSLEQSSQWADKGRITLWIKPHLKLWQSAGLPHTTQLFSSPRL